MPRTAIGPGPKYALRPVVGYKDHDYSKWRYPQYSMGLKLGSFRKELGPGPKYNTENMTMYGKAHPPAFSVVSRKPDLKKSQTPGPAHYDTRRKDPVPPAYSIVSRHPDLSKAETPGPDKYEVPTTIGPKVPDKWTNGAYTMGHKYPLRDQTKSPGPADYPPTDTNLYKNKLPAFTIRQKTLGVAGKAQSPGPIYYPKMGGKSGYSFGLRTDTSPYITADDEMPCINK